MSKKNKKPAKSTAQKKRNRLLLPLCGGVLLIMSVCLFVFFSGRKPPNVKTYQGKLALLESAALTQETVDAVGKSPAGGQAGHAVFLSICDTTERASVFCGTGSDLRAAWKAADKQVTDFLSGSNYDPVWVKADAVYISGVVQAAELEQDLQTSDSPFYRYGVAFDRRFQTALLEAELNGARIFDYENGGIDLEYLNRYLQTADRRPLDSLPETYTVFQCMGWLCDENSTVYKLETDNLSYGRRTETVDADYTRELILSASDFLLSQLKEDGTFVYGIYPRFDKEIESYNMLRHIGAVWSLFFRYRIAPDEALVEKIERAIGYILDNVVYDSEGRAYLYEESTDEIKLGGAGVAVVAMTEYMDVFQNEKYKEVCCALGNGILSMLDRNTGKYYHVLNGDFSRKEESRIVYYDGEATFALCRLYGLTGDPVWLDAAESAVSYFIEADYTQYRDHWVAYSMNEITKYITDNEEYYAFALANAAKNLDKIRDRADTYPANLEMLMATFEVYDRMQENGIDAGDFDLRAFLDTVSVRIERQLNGYFYPEYAMYMANPKRILNTFMVRHDGYRVRIDDVQHTIDGYYLFFKNYDKLVSYGLLGSGS